MVSDMGTGLHSKGGDQTWLEVIKVFYFQYGLSA